CIVVCLNCSAQETLETKDNFRFPDDFKLSLVQGDGVSRFSDIVVNWPAIENTLVYEVQLVELYAEGIAPKTETLSLLGNSIKGLGSDELNGNFQPGFHLRIEGSSKGNEYISSLRKA
ncbi:MAG: hypothetical protein VXB01_16495, partial [Opitutae bacterium]